MEPKDSNLQLALGIDWTNTTHKEEEIWGGGGEGLAWINSLEKKNIKVSLGLRSAGISTKLARSWLKGWTTYTMYVN